MFLHELNNTKEIFDSIAYEKKISAVIVEKDLYFEEPPSFKDILDRINAFSLKL